MAMDVFGKELNIEMDYKNKIRLIYLLALIAIVIMFIFMVINPFRKLNETRKVYEKEQANLVKIKDKFVATQKKQEDVMTEFEKQKEKYAILKIQFEKAAHQNNATFKREIQDVMDYLGVKLSTIGSPEVAPKKEKAVTEEEAKGKKGDEKEAPVKDDELKYEKKYFAYTISGPAPEVSTLFYYLENSKRLITLKDGATDITKSGQNDLNATFKIGTYFFQEEQEEGEKNE
ncbi:hypothetical protein [uncultured Ilyobacter sp.]|uniref:hypothetical protein n=1 Tax=uncultured Ilyobacter sp. TaxID=544433 RepID=UPI0029C7D722|nr:hypothetical protein [uncultured Ilyobacter sp.]